MGERPIRRLIAPAVVAALLVVLAIVAFALVARSDDGDDGENTRERVRALSAAGEDAYNAQIASDGSGRAIVVWQRSDGSARRIQSVRIGADGDPEPVEDLSAAGADAVNPQVAIDEAGRATVVWEREEGGDVRVEAARIDAGGSPEPAQSLSEEGEDGALPQVAIDGEGRATIVWQRSDDLESQIQSVRLDADGAPEKVQTLSEPGEGAYDPQVAVDEAGRATVVWRRSDGANNRIQSVRIDAEGEPEGVQTLSEADSNAAKPQVAIDRSGRATVVWERFDDPRHSIRSIRLAADGTPERVQGLSEAGDDAVGPELAIGGDDRVTVVWRSREPTDQIQAMQLTGDGRSPVEVLSRGRLGAFNPELAIDGSGRATIVWQRSDGSTQRIQSVRLAADGSPGRVATLSEPGEATNPQVAFDSADRAMITWQRFSGADSRIELALR